MGISLCAQHSRACEAKLCRLSAIPIPVLCERKLSLLVASTLSAHAWRRSADAAWSVS